MRNIPDDNLAYSSLLKFDTGSSGSCFILLRKNEAYLVTAKHVLYDNNDKLRGKNIFLTCQTRDINDDNVVTININLEIVKPSYHKNADVAVLKISNVEKTQIPNKYKVSYCEGVKISSMYPLVYVNYDATKKLKDVLVSNDVFLYGYPISLGIKDSPQFDFNKPLLRKGIIANIYKKTGTIILDCPVYYGNSGGPVVEVELKQNEKKGLIFTHKIIGVVSQFIPFVEYWQNKQNGLINTELSNSGYSVVVSMDKVFELIENKSE